MRRADKNRVPAVVVGAGINGLGVLRSLARARVPVIVVGSDAQQPAMRSRYGQKLAFANDKPDAVIHVLEALARDLDGEPPVLFLTQEETVSSVSTHRERLQSLYRFTLPAHDLLTSLMHKDGFRATAEAAGGAIPRTLHVTGDEQIEAISALCPPLVVKPSIRDAGYSSAFRKAYRVESVADAQDVVRRILSVLPDVVIQEWIEGADSDIYFCLQYVTASGETAASFVGRKIRSWPPRVGGTARCAPASTADAQVLTRRTTAFFKHAGIRGFAGMEYKRDVCSGRFYMVEPTLGRTDYQAEVATVNGVNIPLAAYRAELGLPRIFMAPCKPVRVWRDRVADQQSAGQADGKTSWQPENARTVDALWRISDPMPAGALLFGRAKSRVLRLMPGRRNRQELES